MTIVALTTWYAVNTYHSRIERAKFQACYQRFAAKTSFTDADLAYLKPYLLKRHLESLDLSRTLISDEAAITLNEFTSLQQLSLDVTRFSDHGLVQLQQLHDLSQISVVRTQVTWQGAFTCSEQHPGTIISVSDGRIWGFAMNGEFTISMIGQRAAVSFAAMAKVNELKGLHCISSPCPLCDTDLAAFAGCKMLERLELLDPQITDKSVDTILSFQKLRQLTLPKSISPAAASKVKEGLPQCKEFIYLGHTTASSKNVR